MPISLDDLMIANTDGTAAFVVADPEATVQSVRWFLPADRNKRAWVYVVAPLAGGTFLVLRWIEIELLALATQADVAGTPLGQLLRLAAQIDSEKTLQTGAKRITGADLAARLAPAQGLQHTATSVSQARAARDAHPGRRLVLLDGVRVLGLYVTELLSASSLRDDPFAVPTTGAPPVLGSPPVFAGEARRLDAAMPLTGAVERTTEVWVKVALAASAGLRNELPAFTRAGDRVGPEALQGAEGEVEFATDADSTLVYIDVTAPGYTPAQLTKALKVPRSRDMPTAKVLLTPTRAGNGQPITISLYQDQQTRAPIAELTLYQDVAGGEAAALQGAAQQILMQLGLALTATVSGEPGGRPQLALVNNGSITIVGNVTNSNGVSIGAGATAIVGGVPPAQSAAA